MDSHHGPPDYLDYPDYSAYTDYALSTSYDDDDEHEHEHALHGQANAAGVRLLTSVEDTPESRLYVQPVQTTTSSPNHSVSIPPPSQQSIIHPPASDESSISRLELVRAGAGPRLDPREVHDAASSPMIVKENGDNDGFTPSPLRIKEHSVGGISTPERLSQLRAREEARTTRPCSSLPSVASAEPGPPHPDHGRKPEQVLRSPTVKLQKKKRQCKEKETTESTRSGDVVARPYTPALHALPTIPEGPSPRKSALAKSSGCQASPGEGTQDAKYASTHVVKFADLPPEIHSPPQHSRMAYQPSNTSLNSHRSSIRNPPSIPPPDSIYIPYHSPGTAAAVARDRPGSPIRPWTPSSISDFPRPTPSPMYEPVDIDGSPRPGSPASRYGGSPRRPLPRAPLFGGPNQARESTTSFQDDVTVSIPMDYVEEEDEYGPETDISDSRPFHAPPPLSPGSPSQETLSEIIYGNEKFEHYGPAPEGKQERRGIRPPQMSKKEVQLINGELVLECKIPTILYSFLPRRDEVEFTHMRYTAVTCDPDDFVPRGYKLRQNIGRTARETELFICVTMYNEDEVNFTRTMHAVMKNISHFCSRSRSRTWGESGWKKIVLCIVSDGREKIHFRTLDALAAMGVYQHGIAKNFVNSKAVQAHVYEYTTQVSLDSDLKFKGAEKGIVPCQIIFCLKEKNQRKLNSHRWFFNAFARALNPNVCILLDVGTRPGSNSLYHLWKAFDTDSNVAGACGEIKAMKGRLGSNLLNPLVASQNFEYKMSNILDKPLESVFGYITVLPGALSAYRYHALQNDETGHGPLSQYFKGETLHGQHADVFTANMYLAEDRILCWELVAKRGERWVLKYVKGCTGETDVPDTVPEFISQRRRWLNGAFFAAVYSLVHFRQIWATDHTIARKVLLHIEFVYQFLQLMFTFFSLANFYLTFFFIAGGIATPQNDPFGHGVGMYIFTVLRYVCVLLISTQFILSLGNRPQGAKRLYFISMVIYGIIMLYTQFACVYIVVRQFSGVDGKKPDMTLGNNVFTNLLVSTASTLGLYFAMSLLYLEPWHLLTSLVQYFILLPSYICTLQVYAFCNTHDVTWGTKGDNISRTDLGNAVGKGNSVELEMPSEQLDIDSGYDEALRNLRDRVEVPEPALSEAQMQEDYYKSVRTYMVVTWMVTNAILAMAASEAYGGSSIGDNFYLRFILWSVAGLALFRAIGSTAFAIVNAVNMVVEGRMKMSLKVPRWMGGVSSRVSDTLSGIGSSMR